MRALAPFSGPPTAAVLGRDERLDPAARVADERHQLARLRLRRHDAQELLAPELARGLGALRLRQRQPRQRPATSSRRSSSASRPSRAWPTPCTPRTTTSAGTSPARRASSAPRPPSASCSGLNEQQMVWALGLAATQAAGLREMFGSMAKAFHPGRSAQNGYAAALLAQAGFTAGERGIEGARGFAAVTASRFDLSKITDRPRRRLRPAREHLQAVPVRHRQPSDHRRVHPAARRASHPRRPRSPRCSCGWRRWSWTCATRPASPRGCRASSPSIMARPSGSCAARPASQEYTDAAVNDPAVKRVRELTRGERAIRRSPRIRRT